MDTNIKNQNLAPPQPEQKDPVKDEKYAQALLAMANMEQKLKQADTPQKKPLISKKRLVYIIVTTALTKATVSLTQS